MRTIESDNMTFSKLSNKIQAHKSAAHLKQMKCFFKTGIGDYAEHDVFIGVKTPQLRQIAGSDLGLSVGVLSKCLQSEIHEYRLFGAIMLTLQYSQAPQRTIEIIWDHIDCFNNWDIVDTMAPKTLGTHYVNKDANALRQLAKSHNQWNRRLAMVSSLAFIQLGKFDYTLKLAAAFLEDKAILMHKATGWMLREIAKRDKETLDTFLKENIMHISATTLSYSTEHYTMQERKAWQLRRKRLNAEGKI